VIERSAPLAKHHLWRRIYDASMDYTEIDGYGPSDAELTADAVTDTFWTGSRRRALRGLARMPRPGNLLNIGCFLSVEVANEQGTIVIHRFGPQDRVPLYWSEDLQACLVLPYLRTTKCVYRPTAREDRLARVWARGRPATCAKLCNAVPAPPFPIARATVAVSYRSDKFTHGRPRHYIHHTEAGVKTYFARAPRGKPAPTAIMIRGGKLCLTPDGLEG
jgi:hypothetical protein